MASLPSILKRKERTGVLINVTDQSVQLARLGRLHERPLTLDSFSEIPAGDETAISNWFQASFPDRDGEYLSAYCGFHPHERIISREAVNLRRLNEPAYLQSLVCDYAKIESASSWQIGLLHPNEGSLLTTTGAPRAGLLVATPHEAAREFQRRMTAWGVYPRRLELGTVSMLGGLARHAELNSYPNALVVCEISHAQTRAYFVAKDGVHTPAHLPHGLLSIEEIAMKEFGAPDLATARHYLEEPTEAVRMHGRRLVRVLARHLRPAVDYFEMQTGQRSGALFCAHLPASLAWLAQALSASVDLELFLPNFSTWLPAVGLQVLEPALLGSTWLQPLTLVAQLAPAPDETS